MPSYAKFIKGILSRKLKLEELETIALTEECSAMLQQKSPPKLKDPGCFTIPCTIGKLSFDKCLCDLGASINMMPLSVFIQLGLPDPKPTNISLQLVDRSITYPRGIVEDVLVKVDKLIFPVDFVIIDFEEDNKILIILGRPFLATCRTLIDVQKGELTMRVRDQDVTFNVFNAMKFPTDEEECYKVELVDSVVNSEMEQLLRSDTLERALTGESEIEDDEGAEQLQLLNASPWKRKLDMPFESLGIAELKNSQERLKPSIEEDLILELKSLSDHLRYAYLECLAAFEILKKKLTTTSVITAPDWGELFEMMCDSSDFVVEDILSQRKKNIFHTVYYTSKTLNDAQLNYTTMEKELLAEFELEIKDRKGTKNQVADHLSRLEDQVDYVSKWVEVKAFPNNDARVVITFLHTNIFTHFGTPRVIISDEGTYLYNHKFTALIERYRVNHRVATTYHPQTNGQAEASNREIKRILEKVLLEKGECSKLMSSMSFVYRLTRTTSNTRRRLRDGKLKSRWSGPFRVKTVFPHGAVEIFDKLPDQAFKVNGQRLKHYFGDC
ncbi:uncharacterized protein LOC141691274 [Apium graveolens]|uniref:uncharacterized protein LOC141691274 n=1 Tax=Apium graveolens TaxID=4045 RepID=UPI003D78B53F